MQPDSSEEVVSCPSAISPILISAMCLQIAKFGELAQVALGGGRVKTEVGDNLLGSKFAFIDHKL